MNNIELSTIYLPILDEVYKEGAKTSVLDGDETTVRKGNNGEIKIAKLDMDALGDFESQVTQRVQLHLHGKRLSMIRNVHRI